MSELHVVVGAGPVGSGVARTLAEAGHRVRVVTRSGSGPDHPAVERVAADAADPAVLGRVGAGATALYNAANPPYTRWPVDWPPLAASLLQVAGATGAVLATVSNLYVYGRVDAPMTERTPLRPHDSKGRVRVAMWQQALAAHEQGRVRYVEVRGSDYPDAPAATSHLSRHVPAVRAGRRCRVMGSPDQPHSWTATADVVALLVAAAADPTSHGRAWHVPTAPPRTQRQALTDLAELAGAPAPRVAGTPAALLRAVGTVAPYVREVAGTVYQFTDPFVVDDSAAREHFGLRPQPWATTLAQVLAQAPAAGTAPGLAA
ncbi:NAD-dependent epimerase/dehydratase family protein [Jannaschia sp. R86511]|uniref:NAD-dependent epimerase/dehydratase family protein n=1 Tax=Jannaschia sp. R86511 TaxID=3093853 RepID=UPI0036D34D35